MPYSPKTPCRLSGCPKLTSREYCEKHRKIANNHYNKYQRDPECNKRYNHYWRKIRKEFLNLHPICEMCKHNGKITPTQEIHHCVSLSSGGTHDFENLEALCKSCHSKISAESGERWRNKECMSQTQ